MNDSSAQSIVDETENQFYTVKCQYMMNDRMNIGLWVLEKARKKQKIEEEELQGR